ncbi:hypothetical protein I8F73_00655 [Enterococcus faecalis]|nr:hypothetical protein [Enterococcus faecalis]
MIIKTVRSLSGYLSEEFRQVSGIYSRSIVWNTRSNASEKQRIISASGQFDPSLVITTGKTYFGGSC